MTSAEGFWDGIAERYAKSPVKDVPAYERTLERTRAHLSPRDRVLELGCGTGTTALKLAGDVGEITGTDISARMIAIARDKAAADGAANARFERAEIARAGAGQAPYDAVLAFNLLHLVDDLPAALSRIAELVRPGGVFVSKTVCLKGGGWYFRPMIALMQLFGRAPGVAFLDTAGLEAAIEAAGFEIVERDDHATSPPCRFVVARRAG